MALPQRKALSSPLPTLMPQGPLRLRDPASLGLAAAQRELGPGGWHLLRADAYRAWGKRGGSPTSLNATVLNRGK